MLNLTLKPFKRAFRQESETSRLPCEAISLKGRSTTQGYFLNDHTSNTIVPARRLRENKLTVRVLFYSGDTMPIDKTANHTLRRIHNRRRGVTK